MLTVNSSKTLTVSKDGQLTVAGAVNNSGSIIVVSDENESGSIIATSASSFTLSYDLFIPATQWKLVGIPVSGVTIGDIMITWQPMEVKLEWVTMIQKVLHGLYTLAHPLEPLYLKPKAMK